MISSQPWRHLLLIVVAVVSIVARGQAQEGSSSTYYLIAPLDSTSTFLLDDQLRVVNEWQSQYRPGLAVYLLPDGSLLRTAAIDRGGFPRGNGTGGRVELFTWDGALQWSVEYATDRVQQHHDAILLPNGNVLLVAWEKRTVAEAIAAGRRLDTLPSGPDIWSDMLVEIDPRTGQTVWLWRVWDHLLPPGRQPSDHPELIDPNYAATVQNWSTDWTHFNAVAYNAQLDQVVVTSRHLSEIWIIDHGTTTQEAAGHSGGRRGRGGDLLYRWGNPGAYGATGPRQLFAPHNAHWIPDGVPGAGNILIFNNGEPNVRPWSSAVEIVPPLQTDGRYAFDSGTGFGPSAPMWEYVADPPESLFGGYASGVQRLPNGNTLLALTPTGRFREVSSTRRVVRDYQLAVGGRSIQTFRVGAYASTLRFAPRSAPAGRVVFPVSGAPGAPQHVSVTVTDSTVALTWSPPENGEHAAYVVEAGSAPGQSDVGSIPVGQSTGFNISGVPPGVYYVRVRAQNGLGTGPPSSDLQVQVGCDIPAPPVDLRVSQLDRLVTLMWQRPGGGAPVTDYVLTVGSAPGLENLLVQPVGPQTSFSATAPTGEYYVRVRARGACGVGGASNEAVVVIP